MRYICTGRVHPERAAVSFSRIELGLADGSKVVASCDSSQLTVLLDSPSLDGWIAAQIMADDMANVVIGALGFSLGSGYSVELVQVTEEDGTAHVFGVRPSGDTSESTLAFEPMVEVFNRALRLAGRDVFFRLALRDYRRAITDVTDCATYCYRAIEGMKGAFVFRTGKDQWTDMHSALGTDRVTIESTVKAFADPVRHGNWLNAKHTNKFQRWEMLCLTKDILLKYLNYSEPTS
jgi:hypothetical protein